MQSSESLLKEYLELQKNIEPLAKRQNEIKELLSHNVYNNSHDGVKSESFDVDGLAVKVKKTNRMNVKLKQKELDSFIGSGGVVPDGLIETKQSVHKSTLKKLIEQEDNDKLLDIQSFTDVNYTSSISVEIK